MSKLPRKLSALIRVALADLRAVEADPLYSVLMLTWHEPTEDGPCLVCLAGAVMAKSLNVPIDRDACGVPDVHDDLRLDALNAVRMGEVDTALDLICSGDWGQVEDVPAYEKSPKAFHAFMADLANRLEAAGL